MKDGKIMKETGFSTDNSIMENILGENIKKLRKERGIKQATLASELKIGRQTLSSYECGVALPDILLLISIADYFGVSLDELTGRSEHHSYL